MGDIWPFVDRQRRDDFVTYISSAPFAVAEDAVTTECSEVYRDRIPGIKTHNFELLRNGRGYLEQEW